MQWIFHAFDLNENRLGDTWKMQLASNGNIFGQNSINFLFFFFFRKISFRRFNAKAHVAGSFAFLYILRRSSFDFSSNPLCRYASIEIRANIAPERLEVDVSVKFLIFEGIQLALESKSYSKNSENQDWCTKGQALCSKISWKYFQAYQDKPS